MTGETSTFQWSEDGTFTIGHEIDMEPLLDQNQRKLIESDSKAAVKRGWLPYASGITNTIILKWRREHNVDFFNQDDWPKVLQLLNSREYRKLKVTELNHDR